jgi:colanic acid/amylovoran biosynthesis glycosyltransferase
LSSPEQPHFERGSILHVVSIFPALREVFVLRDAREMIRLGWTVFLGQLRPAGRRPRAIGFNDLRPHVSKVNLLSFEMAKGFVFCVRKLPKRTIELARICLRSWKEPWNLLKTVYILLASMQLSYRFRNSRLTHVRGHHLHSEALAAMFVGGFLEIPYSFKCYTVKLHYPRSIITEIVHRSDFAVADTLQVKAFLKNLGASDAQLHLIRNGVRLSDFSFRNSQDVSGNPVILAIGGLDYKKGFHVLLKACALLRGQGVDFRCVIVGEGTERQRLEDLKRRLNLNGDVHMCGKLSFAEIQSWYQRAAILVVPSVVAPDGSTDGLPTVVTEAFVMGVPVIGTDTAGIPEVIQEGSTGFVVPANHAEILANRIARLLENGELRSRFAGEARKLAEEVFDLERNSQVLSKLILGEQHRTHESVDPAGCAYVSSARA